MQLYENQITKFQSDMRLQVNNFEKVPKNLKGYSTHLYCSECIISIQILGKSGKQNRLSENY